MGIILYGDDDVGFRVRWFEKPGHIDRYNWNVNIRIAGKYECYQTKNQIKILKKE